MLRLRQNLLPRVPNSFAVISAILLLISLLAGNIDSMFASNRSLNPSVSARQEPAQESPAGVQTAARQDFRISLMILR